MTQADDAKLDLPIIKQKLAKAGLKDFTKILFKSGKYGTAGSIYKKNGTLNKNAFCKILGITQHKLNQLLATAREVLPEYGE